MFDHIGNLLIPLINILIREAFVDITDITIKNSFAKAGLIINISEIQELENLEDNSLEYLFNEMVQ